MKQSESIMSRMKKYEQPTKAVLTPRMPVIARIDGRAFHSYAKQCKKPFDNNLINAMNQCAIALCKDIQGAQVAYVQSDEISVLIHSYKRFNSQAWFANEVQKMVSISAAIAASVMTAESPKLFSQIKLAQFDSRVFTIPEDDVTNYFVARQQDWSRNSVQMLARSYYSHKQCDNKNNSQLQEMIHLHGDNWNDLPTHLKRGRCIVKEQQETPCSVCKGIGIDYPHSSDDETCLVCRGVGKVIRSQWIIDNETPIFSQDRDYIEKYLEKDEG